MPLMLLVKSCASSRIFNIIGTICFKWWSSKAKIILVAIPPREMTGNQDL